MAAVALGTAARPQVAAAAVAGKDLVRLLYEQLFSQGNLDLVDVLFDDAYTDHQTDAPTGRDGVRRWVADCRPMLPICIRRLMWAPPGAMDVPRHHGRGVSEIAHLRDGWSSLTEGCPPHFGDPFLQSFLTTPREGFT